MKKIQFEDYKEPYLNAETLKQIQDNVEEAINEKGSGSGIHIGNDEPADTNVWINPEEPLSVVGTEVVDSLNGNESNKAPSVRTIKNDLFNDIVFLGEAANEDKIINLTNDTLLNYKFLVVSSGYGYSKSMTIIPVSLFKQIGGSYFQCYQYVKTYNSNAYTSIQYISDTSLKINGAVGVDTITTVHGVK